MKAIELEPANKLTVFLGSDERHHHMPLYEEVMNILHKGEIIGATVTKGVLGYGVKRRIHSVMNEIAMENLPLVIEVIDEKEKIEAAAVRIAELLGEHGLVEILPTSIVKRTIWPHDVVKET